MKTVHFPFLFALVMVCSPFTNAQDKEAQPVIITLLPDSVLAQCDYTPMFYHVVSISSQILGDPTNAAMKTLQEEIIEFCKQ
jgi:hypothetical protein